jgi:hypothetical protein
MDGEGGRGDLWRWGKWIWRVVWMEGWARLLKSRVEVVLWRGPKWREEVTVEWKEGYSVEKCG